MSTSPKLLCLIRPFFTHETIDERQRTKNPNDVTRSLPVAHCHTAVKKSIKRKNQSIAILDH